MKLFTALVVIAFAGSSAAVSDFTTNIVSTYSTYMDMSIYNQYLDTIYPDCVSMSVSAFGNLVQDSTPVDVKNYILTTRKSYKPWYTAIQTNVNKSREAVRANLTALMKNFQKVSVKIEATYVKMVQGFKTRGCVDYSQYQQDVQNKVTMALSTMPRAMANFPANLNGAIPQMMVASLANRLSSTISSSGTSLMAGISALDSVKQVDSIFMDSITNSCKKAVVYTTDYIKDYFAGSASITMTKIDAALADMVNGVKTATCS